MKTQKGAVNTGVLAVVVIALVVLAVGAYFVFQQNFVVHPRVPIDSTANTIPPSVNTQPATTSEPSARMSSGPSETVSGNFTYSNNRALPARFYVSEEQSAPENKEPFIVFPNENATIQLFGINPVVARTDNCERVVRATIQISDRRSATIGGIAADVANLIRITTKAAPEEVCLTT